MFRSLNFNICFRNFVAWDCQLFDNPFFYVNYQKITYKKDVM